MNTNILKRELADNWKSLLFWCLGTAVLVGVCVTKYPSVSQMGAGMHGLIEAIPKAMRPLLGMGQYDMSSLSGYYAICYSYLMLLAGLHALLTGSGILSKEERGKTAEFLLSKPIQRHEVLIAKLTVAAVSTLLVNATAWCVSVALFPLVDSGGMGAWLTGLMLGMLAFQWLFAALGFMISACIPASWNQTAAAVLFFALFFVKYAADVLDSTSLNVLTPFGWLDARAAVAQGGFPWPGFIAALVLAGGAGYLGFWRYRRRDIRL